MPRVAMPDALRGFAESALGACAVPAEAAAVVADSLVIAELWGHASHGLLRLPWLVTRLQTGAMSATAIPAVVSDHSAVVVLDGKQGIGQVVAGHATSLGIERAKMHGLSCVAVRNSNHFGTAAYFTRRVAEAGCAGLLVTNSSPAMTPWGGREVKTVGSNPWSIAAPAGSYGTVVLDIANTAVARGKIYVASERGEQIPSGWATDRHGMPTTDPREAISGILLPMAGHKGYAISFMVDVLAGVLTGSQFGSEVVGPYDPSRSSGCGHLLVVVNIASISDYASYLERIEKLITETKSVPTAFGYTEIYFPGEPEDRMLAHHQTSGIAIADITWQRLEALATDLGVDLPHTL